MKFNMVFLFAALTWISLAQPGDKTLRLPRALPILGKPDILAHVNKTQMQDALALAEESSSIWCVNTELLSAEVREARKNMFKSSVGSLNIVDDFLRIPGIFQGRADEQVVDLLMVSLLFKGVAFVLIIALVLYCMCCGSVCFTCRCFKRKLARPTQTTKCVCLVVFAVLAAGMIIAVVVGWIYQAKILPGVDDTMCVLSRATETTLNGGVQGGKKSDFVGLLPALETLENLNASLQTNSSFLQNITATFSDPENLTNAFTQFRGTVAITKETLEVGSNVTLHRCLVCDEVAKILSQADTTLKTTIPEKMEELRQMIEVTATNSPVLESARSFLGDATDLILQAGNEIATRSQDVLDLKYRTERESSITSLRVWALILPLVLLLLIGFCLNCFSMKKLCHGPSEHKQHNTSLRNAAGVGWCCNCLSVLYVFMLAGLLMIITDMTTSGCLFLDDLDGDRLREVVNSMTNNTADQDQLARGAQLYDTCLTENGSYNFLDAVASGRNCSGKANCTAKELIDEVVANLNDLANTTIPLSNISILPEAQKLSALYTFPIASLVMLNVEEAVKDGRYLILSTDPRGIAIQAEGLQVGLMTGLECETKTVDLSAVGITPAQIGFEASSAQIVIPGIEDFVEKLDRFNYDVYDTSVTAVEDAISSGVTCPILNPVTCPESDVTVITDLPTLRGLVGLMEICARAKSQANIVDATFDAHLVEFRSEMEAKFSGGVVDNGKLQTAQDYLMNRNPSTQTAGRMTCDPCTAGNSLLLLKKQMLATTRKELNCPSFIKNGLVCDSDVAGADCTVTVNGTVTYETSNTMCSVVEWTTHYRKFAQRHTNSVQEVEEAATTWPSQVLENSISQVNRTIVAPMLELTTGLSSCRYIFDMKRDLVSSVCYNGPIFGFYGLRIAYLLMSVSAFIMGILIFLLWSRATDGAADNIPVSSQPALVGHTI